MSSVALYPGSGATAIASSRDRSRGASGQLAASQPYTNIAQTRALNP
jgi:hypothetical protein